MSGVRGRLFRRVLAVVVLAFGLAGAARADDGGGASEGRLRVAALSPSTSLAGGWRFHVGDDPAWASPRFDDGAWETLRVPGDWGRQGHPGHAGFGWYRLEVALPPGAADGEALAVTVGKVHDAYELWAGGRRVGGVGRFPPSPATRYDREATWTLPRGAVAPDGRLVLALRVWRGAAISRPWQGGPYEGDFRIGTAAELADRRWREALLPLVLAALYAVVGVYHLYLYRRRPVLGEYLWYGLLTLAIASYALLTSQAKHGLPGPWLLWKRCEYANLFLLPALCLQSVWTLVGLRPGRPLGAYRASFAVLAALAFALPTLPLLFRLLDFWLLWMLPCAVGLAALVAVRAWRGDAEARTILVGVLLFSLAALNDAAVDRRLLATPRIVPLGFGAFILSMAMSLANRFTRVFAELEARTAELQRAQADLVRTEKLSAIGGMVAGLVHDLRNPVAAIHTYAALAAAQGTPEQREMLRRIQDETGRSVDMMEDVLAFARGSVRVAPTAVALAPWLGEICDYLRRELDVAMVEVELAGDLEGSARLDPARLRRVVCNLAWNARDAMPEGGRFAIEVARTPTLLRLACSDTGPGVAPEIRARLFAEFATWGKANGTGLGLALSRTIVQEHGGEIRYEDAPGGGARFVVDLPQPAGPAPI